MNDFITSRQYNIWEFCKKPIFYIPATLIIVIIIYLLIPKGSPKAILLEHNIVIEVGESHIIGTSSNEIVNFSSNNPQIVVILGNNSVYGIEAGSTTITAKSKSGRTETCTVTVVEKQENIDEPVEPTKPVETSIKLNTSNINLNKGQSFKLIASTNSTNKYITWTSSNSSIASVDSNGKVTAKAAGTATITAKTADGKTATCTITVTITEDKLVLNYSNAELIVGKTLQLVAPTATSSVSNTLTWTSNNPAVAKVDTNGKVSAIAIGTATITAKASNGKTATCTITVTKSSVSLNNTSLKLNKGATATLIATITPSGTNESITWTSSNSSIASVDSNGKVTAKAAGTATITAKTSSGGTATCTITVTQSSVSLNNTSLKLNKGATATLIATITPSGTNESITWTSSNSSVASVDSNGKVTAKAAGTATITAKTSSGGTATCTITVEIAVTSIKLDKSSLSLVVGKTSTLVATISPSDATNKVITWSSSNSKVASVDSNGKVTAKAGGTATITAKTNNGKTATCTITVTKSSVSLNNTSLKLNKGATATLTATITPSGTNESITWTSSNSSIASVDSNGKVTAKAAGTATITAKTSSGGSATCTITVEIAATSIKLNKSSLSLVAGKTSTLVATISPSDATNKAITWSSSNSKVASVDSNGKVTAKTGGTATITAKTNNGKTATCTITVTSINKIHFIKQTQASDAILLESNGHYAMIDTSYSSSTNNKKVYNYLKGLGVKKLDFVFLTHIHKDHTGGFEYLANRLPIDRLYIKTYIGKDNEPGENKPIYKNIKAVASSKSIPITYIEKSFSDGKGFTFQDMSIKLYNTPQRMDQSQYTGLTENVNSVFELITVNGKKIFLAADSHDDDIMTSTINKIGGVDIYKLAHHGLTNCALTMDSARKLNPKYLVITNGKTTYCHDKYFSNINSKYIYYVNEISKNAVVFTIEKSISVDY